MSVILIRERVPSTSCFAWNGEFLRMWFTHIFCEIKTTYLYTSSLQLWTVLASLPEALGRSSKLWLVNIVLGATMNRTHALKNTVAPKWGLLVSIEIRRLYILFSDYTKPVNWTFRKKSEKSYSKRNKGNSILLNLPRQYSWCVSYRSDGVCSQIRESWGK